MNAQVRPSGESLTNYVALLWVKVGQPWNKVCFIEHGNVVKCRNG